MASYEQMKAQGARCDVCPLRLRSGSPCSSEHISRAQVVAVAQNPGEKEVEADRPLVGRSGRYFNKALKAIGRDRRQVSTANVVACMPPGADLGKYERKLKRINRQRDKDGKAPIPLPSACCAPRLHRDVRRYPVVVPLGAIAARALIPWHKKGIQSIRGRLIEIPADVADASERFHDWDGLLQAGIHPGYVPGRKLVATYNPAFVLRFSQWKRAFLADLDRAFRWLHDRLHWTPPTLLYRPDIDTLEKILLRDGSGLDPDNRGLWRPVRALGHPKVHAHDWETDDLNPVTANPRCLGIGASTWALVLPYQPVQWRRSIEKVRREASKIRKRLEEAGIPRDEAIALAQEEASSLLSLEQFYRLADGSTLPLYTPEERAERDRIVPAWMARTDLWKVGWNNLQYDARKYRALYGTMPANDMDGMFYNRNAESDTRNSLGYVTSVRTDMPDWKGSHTATEARDDETLWQYNGYDVSATTVVLPSLAEDVRKRETARVVDLDHRSQRYCVGMTDTGIKVDMEERERLHHLLASPGPVTIRTCRKIEVDGPDGRKRRVLARNPDGSLETKKIPMGGIQQHVTRLRRILASDTKLDLSHIVRRTRKLDKENQRRRELARRRLAEVDPSTPALPQAAEEDDLDIRLPELHELSLDDLAFNPYSHPQVRAVLFDEWGLEPPTDLKDSTLYTKSGEISTGDAVLRRLWASPHTKPHQKEAIRALRMARRVGKLWGTYVRPWRMPVGDHALDKGCVVWTDGRIHPTWNQHVAVTGRQSSSGPNAQNEPPIIKMMMIAEPHCDHCGEPHVLVGGDLSQVELRAQAARWGISSYLDAFSKGMDLYQATMAAIFGMDEIRRYDGFPEQGFGTKTYRAKSQYERQRKLAKAVELASGYAAGCAYKSGEVRVVDRQTIYRMISAAEDQTGNPAYPDLTQGKVDAMHDALLEAVPERRQGWEREAEHVNRYGFIREPVHGRRRDFTEERKRNLNEFVNFPIQGGCAALMNDVLHEVAQEIPWGRWGPNTGIVATIHDYIGVECPLSQAEYVYDVLKQALTRTHPAYPGVQFTAEVAIAYPDKDPYGRGLSRLGCT